MVRRHLLARAAGALLSFWCVLGLSAGAARATEDGEKPVVVVVHQDVPIRDLAVSELREIILGQRRFWSNGTRVELIVEAKPTPGRRAFVETLSRMSELQFQQYWVGQIFSQRATRAPRAAPDRRLALALVSAIPGALTVVEAGALPPMTRVLTVNSRAPEDERYPLRSVSR